MSIKIGFVLLSSSINCIPSTRISCINMFPFLRSAGFEPHIIFEPVGSTETPCLSGLNTSKLAQEFKIIYFQKVRGPYVESLAKKLSLMGVKIIYGVCDLIEVAMVGISDATIVVTEFLKSQYPQELQEKIHVVHDGIEKPEIFKNDWGIHQGTKSDPLRAILVTSSNLSCLPILDSPPRWLEVNIVGRYPSKEKVFQRLRECRWWYMAKPNAVERFAYLRFLANGRILRQKWDPVNVYEAIRDADIGIIPIDQSYEHVSGQTPPSWKLKSENRLTMKMCAGLPVIATPIPAYEGIIQHGHNGFFASTKEDWLNCLNVLRDPSLRKTIGIRARETVYERYSMQMQADKLISVFRMLVSNNRGIKKNV